MALFISLGSNYRRNFGAYSLSARAGSAKLLEEYLTQRYAAKQTVLTYKGREAIALALKNLNLPAGSLVAVNGYTCYAVYQAITAAGLRPLYLDIPKDGLNFRAGSLLAALDQHSGVKTVLVQNTFGIACDIADIRSICKKHNLKLIEDLAHCAGLIYPTGGEAGTVGDAAAFSFSQDKAVDAVSGGACVLKNGKIINIQYKSASLSHRFKSRLYPWATWIIRNTFDISLGRAVLKVMRLLRLLPGPMSGSADKVHVLPAWHCDLALKNFQNLAGINRHRQTIAEIYRQSLPKTLQFEHVGGAIYLRFPIRVKKPADLIKYLKSSGIYLNDRWYDAPVAPARTLKLSGYVRGTCPNAEKTSTQILNLPTHINVSERQAKLIAEKVNGWLKS